MPKNTKEFSEKIKRKAKSRKEKSSQNQGDSKKSTPITPMPNYETAVKPVHTKPLDGSMKIDHLPFKTQAEMIFNPLVALQQRSEPVGESPVIKTVQPPVLTSLVKK